MYLAGPTYPDIIKITTQYTYRDILVEVYRCALKKKSSGSVKSNKSVGEHDNAGVMVAMLIRDSLKFDDFLPTRIIEIKQYSNHQDINTRPISELILNWHLDFPANEHEASMSNASQYHRSKCIVTYLFGAINALIYWYQVHDLFKFKFKFKIVYCFLQIWSYIHSICFQVQQHPYIIHNYQATSNISWSPFESQPDRYDHGLIHRYQRVNTLHT